MKSGENLDAGGFQSTRQLSNQFSMTKSLPNSDLLFENDKQAAKLLKSTTTWNFHSLLNPRRSFEICPKLTKLIVLTFETFAKIDYFEILTALYDCLS